MGGRLYVPKALKSHGSMVPQTVDRQLWESKCGTIELCDL